MSDSSKIVSPWGKGSMRALREISKLQVTQDISTENKTTSEISNEITEPLLQIPWKPAPSTPTPQKHKLSNEITDDISNKTTTKQSKETVIEIANKISNETSTKTSNEPASKPFRKTINETSNKIASETSNETIKKRYIHLDSTHTSAEQKVYSVMYRETISKGINGRRFSVAEMMELTGINSNTTIIRAIKGLAEKYSIEVVSREGSRRYGVLYKVNSPTEITQLRNENNILIEQRRKEIIRGKKGTWNETTSEITNETLDSMSIRTSGRHADSYAENKHLDVQKINNSAIHIIIDKNKEKLGDDASSSSSPTQTDDEKLSKVRNLFEQISNGGTWKDERDFSAFEQIKRVSLWHIIMGLCYSVVRSPEHKFNSLAYAVPSILDHDKQMSIFSEQDMLPIAYKTMRQTINCIQSGKWSIPEWLAGEDPNASR